MSREPSRVEVGIVEGVPLVSPLDVVRNGERPLPNDEGILGVLVVAARGRDVRVLVHRDATIPLKVSVIVVGSESRVWEVLGRVARAPESGHHLDVNSVVVGHVEAVLDVSDGL